MVAIAKWCTEMHHEINPPDEILRRLIFVLYLVMVVIFLVAALLALVQQRYDYLQLSFLGVIVAVGLRHYGVKHLEFNRLAVSFPCGAEQDCSDSVLSREIKSLLAEASQVKDDWPKRQQLRQRLAYLLDKNPDLWLEFRGEIDEVFPALAHWKGKAR